MTNEKPQIMVIGCARSGTKYTSEVFNNLGFDVGHEKVKENGIVSWCLVPNTDIKLWEPSSNEVKKYNMPVIHQVREPISCISSIMTLVEFSWKFIGVFVPINEKKDSLLLKSMKYWYYWNILAENKACFSFKIEDIENNLEHILKIGNFPINKHTFSKIKNVSKNSNSREHEMIKWEDIEKENPKLTKRIKELSIKYGY